MLANQPLTRRYLRRGARMRTPWMRARHDMFEDTMGMLEYDEGAAPRSGRNQWFSSSRDSQKRSTVP